MQISQDTLDFISDLKKFSRDKLKNENDLSILIEVSRTTNQDNVFSNIVFTARYINGLSKILQSNSRIPVNPNSNGGEFSEDEAKSKVKNEYKKNLKILIGELTDYFTNLDDTNRTHLTSKYLSMTQESMLNLNTLIYDLSWVKTYWNSKK